MSDALVYLLTRPIGNEGNFFSRLGSGVKHWALIVNFLNSSDFYLCEITSNGDIGSATAVRYGSTSASGRSIRRCDKFDSLDACKEKNFEAETIFLGTCTIDIEALNSLTFRLKIDDYNPIFSSCQTFVKRMIGLLNVRTSNGKSPSLPWSTLDLIRYAAAGILSIGGVIAAGAAVASNKVRLC